MGYYSTFTVEVNEYVENLADELKKFSGGYTFYEDGSYEAYAEGKWYTWDTDIMRFSAEYPDVTVTLTRMTEDNENDGRYVLHGGEVIERYERDWKLV